MMLRKFQVQRLVLGITWVPAFRYDFITEASAREEARKLSGKVRVVTVWEE